MGSKGADKVNGFAGALLLGIEVSLQQDITTGFVCTKERGLYHRRTQSQNPISRGNMPESRELRWWSAEQRRLAPRSA
eukprot:COSAG06_NODE_2691_length_6430_cov_2.427648_9_plen_78_part_00